MTKKEFLPALLTAKDIKNFIYNAILQRRDDCIFNRTQMKQFFNISDYQLEVYMEMGLPWFGKSTRKKFYKNECKKWFFDKGIEVKYQTLN